MPTNTCLNSGLLQRTFLDHVHYSYVKNNYERSRIFNTFWIKHKYFILTVRRGMPKSKMNLTPLILRHVFWLGGGGEGDCVPAKDSTNHQNCISNFLSNRQWRFYSQICCIALRVCKLPMGFSVLSIIWGGGGVNHNATHSPTLARKNKTENDSRLVKISEGNRDDEWNFWWEQEADIALFLQEIRIRKKTTQL